MNDMNDDAEPMNPIPGCQFNDPNSATGYCQNPPDVLAEFAVTISGFGKGTMTGWCCERHATSAQRIIRRASDPQTISIAATWQDTTYHLFEGPLVPWKEIS